MPFGAAVAALHRSAGVGEYRPELITAPEVAAMMDRVECYRSADLDAAFPDRWPAEVEIELRDGRTLSERVDFPKGDPENPLTPTELEGKFRELTVGVVTATGQARVIEATRRLGDGTTPADLAGLLGSRAILEPAVADAG